jgi:flagellar assembly factor FliW
MSTQLAQPIATTRFGELDVAPEEVLHFPDGLIGLVGSDYALVAAARGPFTWLQSLTDPAVALPLTDPRSFFPDFRLELSEAEGAHRGIALEPGGQVFVTVRAAPLPSDCTANLKAPIVVAGPVDGGPRIAHQVVNLAPGVQLRTPLFPVN